MSQEYSGAGSPSLKHNDICECVRPNEQFIFPKGEEKMGTGRCLICRKRIVKREQAKPFDQNDNSPLKH